MDSVGPLSASVCLEIWGAVRGPCCVPCSQGTQAAAAAAGCPSVLVPGAVTWSLWGLPLPRPLQEHALQQDTLLSGHALLRDMPSAGHALCRTRPPWDTPPGWTHSPAQQPTLSKRPLPACLPILSCHLLGVSPLPGVLPTEDQNGKMGGGVAISQLDANFEGSTLRGVHVCLKMLLKYYFFLLYQCLD